MVKKKFITFCMCMFAVFSLVGCSKDNKITKIEIIDDTLKTEYVVGEDFIIDDFQLKLTYGNKNEKIYNITEEMVTLSSIDNTIKGKQKVDIKVDYDGMEIKFSIGVEFKIPAKVASINSLIEELPEADEIGFSNEEELILIEDNIDSLSEFYKGYLENYQKFVDCKTKLDSLYEEFITPEFINSRFILKTNLDNFFYSLKQTDYSVDNWELIVKIYDDSIASLYLNENHALIKEIVNGAQLNISKISTLDQTEAIVLRSQKITELINYRNNLMSEDYSSSNWALLDKIKSKYVDLLNVAKSCKEVDDLYISALTELDTVYTKEDERIEALNALKETKIEEVKNERLAIDVTKYSNANRTLIAEYYNLCLDNIRNANNEDEINGEITKFKNKVSILKTIDIEEKELLVEERNNATDEINELANGLDLYKYDSQNKTLIEKIIADALENIKNATNIDSVRSIKNKAFSDIDVIPTMEEQAMINLPIKIQNAKEQIDLIVTVLDSEDYTSDNWAIILSIAQITKNRFDTEITVSTAVKTIEDMIASARNQISNIHTIEEEIEINLNRVKNEAITSLDEYLKNLKEEDFADVSTYELVQTRINNAKIKVFELEDENTIIKLVQDTISAIEDAKK